MQVFIEKWWTSLCLEDHWYSVQAEQRNREENVAVFIDVLGLHKWQWVSSIVEDPKKMQECRLYWSDVDTLGEDQFSMDDNCPIHRSGPDKQWLHDNGIAKEFWPP